MIIGQQEILKVLKDGRSRTLEEINRKLHYQFINVGQSCLRLERWGIIISFYERVPGKNQRMKKVKLNLEI